MTTQGEETPNAPGLIDPTSAVRAATGAAWGNLAVDQPLTEVELMELCNKNFDRILPFVAERVNREQ